MNSLKLAPELHRSIIIESLTDDEHPAFGQVATVDRNGRPHVRTVHLRYLEQCDRIGFGCCVESRKWGQLVTKPLLAGCFYDSYRKIQFRWEGSAQLISATAVKEKEKEIRQWMWRRVRPHIRLAYWCDHKGIDLMGIERLKAIPFLFKLGRCCPPFGVVLCEPDTWDILEVASQKITEFRRTVYVRENGAWVSEAVSPIRGVSKWI